MTDKTDPTDKTEDDSVSYDILEDNCIGIEKNKGINCDNAVI